MRAPLLSLLGPWPSHPVPAHHSISPGCLWEEASCLCHDPHPPAPAREEIRHLFCRWKGVCIVQVRGPQLEGRQLPCICMTPQNQEWGVLGASDLRPILQDKELVALYQGGNGKGGCVSCFSLLRDTRVCKQIFNLGSPKLQKRLARTTDLDPVSCEHSHCLPGWGPGMRLCSGQ